MVGRRFRLGGNDGIFISYRRRGAAAGYVGRLSDRLASLFGEHRIFRDVDTIQLGRDFAESIADAVGSSKALLAVIDRDWLTVTDAEGRRRLDNSDDYVRLEIESALERGISLIPVLVEGTRMPSREDLPDSLQGLARRQALDLGDSRADFETDVQRLVSALEGAGIRPVRRPSGAAVGWGWWLLPVFFNIGSWGSRDHDGQAWQWNGWGGVTVRPSARFDVLLNPWFNLNRHGWQYVATATARTADGASTGRPEYVFAALHQNTVAMTTRVNYTFSPTLSLQLYAQPFISAGAYDSFRRVASPDARAFDSRFETFADDAVTRAGQQYRVSLDGGESITFGNPDFNVRQLRSNAVLRWEYRPGSTLFVVWSQSRNGFVRDGEFSLGRDIVRLFAAPATNVLLVKMNYWLDF
jgi:hypothetical protein